MQSPKTPLSPSIALSGPQALMLDCGVRLDPAVIAYQTYGTLNADKSNALLLCHALTGDQFAYGTHPVTGKPGWAEVFLGPGKAIDTEKFFVICPNVLGSCMGSSGPSSVNPDTGTPYGLAFPAITIFDMVRAQRELIRSLGITQLAGVVGASMGGMQALAWAHLFPEITRSITAIACCHKHSAQNIAFHEVGRQAVMADPDWQGGAYLDHGTRPHRGLAVARMTAHITYMSEANLQKRFGRQLQDRAALSFGFEADFQIESYLRHQGISFVDRFDANAYLYLTRAVDYFDLTFGGQKKLAETLSKIPKYLIISLSSDWLYPPSAHRPIIRALNGIAANVSYVEIDTSKGHDGFLHQEPQFHTILQTFIESFV